MPGLGRQLAANLAEMRKKAVRMWTKCGPTTMQTLDPPVIVPALLTNPNR